MDTINVLIWGHATDGPCAYFRGYQYEEALKPYGIDQRNIQSLDIVATGGVCVDTSEGHECEKKHMTIAEAFAANKMALDTSQIDWADIIVFRRYYNTTRKCHSCNFRTHEPLEHEAHRQTGHNTYTQDDITRVIWPAIEGNAEKAIIYETDDDHFNIASWNGYYQDVVEEWDLIRRMARRADLVTTSTPVLARRYSRFNPNVRVIRNAIDPDLYERDTERPEGDKPRLVYYGSTARMRDYAGFPGIDGKWEGGYAAKAVEENKHLLRRIFMGVDSGTEYAVSPLFDEMTPYIIGIPAFSKSLANMHGDIGIAPLHGDDFDRAKSELHWLEYAMSDMAFIGERFKGGPDDGPYNMIREGKDGLLAKGRQQWYDAVKRLATEPNLRADIAAAAKERVLAEYDYRKRAEEWAEAYRWVIENQGIGRKNQGDSPSSALSSAATIALPFSSKPSSPPKPSTSSGSSAKTRKTAQPSLA